MRISPIVALLLVTLSVCNANAAADVVMVWEDSPIVSEYEVEIARDISFAQVVVNAQTTVSRYVWNHYPEERHFWRVRSVDARGRRSRWSPPRTIVASPKPPTSLSPALRVIRLGAPTSVDVSWERSELCVEYRVEVSEDERFERAVRTFLTHGDSLSVPFDRYGPYHWRVVGIAPSGRETRPTETRRVTVRPRTPNVVGPDTGTRYTELDTISLDWSRSRGVERWQLEVRAGAASARRVVREEPNYTLRPDAPGTIRWRVRAAAKRASSAWSDWFTVEVRKLEPDALTGPIARRRAEPLHLSSSASMPFPSVEPDDSGVHGIVRVGWETNFGALSTPLVAVGVGFTLSSWRFGAELGHSRERSFVESTPVTTHMTPLSLSAHRRWTDGWLRPYVGGVLGARLNRISVDEERLTSTLFSGGVLAGVDVGARSGGWFVEAALSTGTIASDRTQFRSTLFTTTAGYRFESLLPPARGSPP